MKKPSVPSAAIGTASLTPLELTAAYSAFARLGTARPLSIMIETFGATVHPSPSELTEAGRKILAEANR